MHIYIKALYSLLSPSLQCFLTYQTTLHLKHIIPNSNILTLYLRNQLSALNSPVDCWKCYYSFHIKFTLKFNTLRGAQMVSCSSFKIYHQIVEFFPPYISLVKWTLIWSIYWTSVLGYHISCILLCIHPKL